MAQEELESQVWALAPQQAMWLYLLVEGVPGFFQMAWPLPGHQDKGWVAHMALLLGQLPDCHLGGGPPHGGCSPWTLQGPSRSWEAALEEGRFQSTIFAGAVLPAVWPDRWTWAVEGRRGAMGFEGACFPQSAH